MEEPKEAPTQQAPRPSPDALHAEGLALPLRDGLVVRRVRLTDDPEVLELILAGLLNLP